MKTKQQIDFVQLNTWVPRPLVMLIKAFVKYKKDQLDVGWTYSRVMRTALVDFLIKHGFNVIKEEEKEEEK